MHRWGELGAAALLVHGSVANGEMSWWRQRPSLRQRSLPPPAHLTVRYAAVHQECGRPQLSPAMHVQLYRSLLISRDTLQRIFPLLEGTSEGPTTFGRES